MVKLPSPEQQLARAVGERGSDRLHRSRSHHQWGVRVGRRGEELRAQPATLLQLEELANKTVALMEKYAPKSEKHFPMAMELLRLQYNLNFAMVCEGCKGSQYYDELTAPER